MKMRVFVTGGSGFVGGALVRRLVTDGHEVVGLARSDVSTQRLRAAGAVPVAGDLTEPERSGPDATAPTWLSALQHVDAVVHVAAHMEFWGPDSLFERANLVPTVALHAASVDAGVRRFVLISAASVSTGSQRRPVVDESMPDGRPNTAYSRVKLATEHTVLAAESGNTELVVLRPPFIWGRGMTTIDAIAAAAESGRFAWIDDGRHIVDVTGRPVPGHRRRQPRTHHLRSRVRQALRRRTATRQQRPNQRAASLEQRRRPGRE